MDSWWSLGEGYGQQGGELGLYQIACPFCMERGNFKLAFHAEKKKPNASKKLNFDTYECGNCKGYVMVLWSANQFGDLYNYRVLPWPIQIDRFPEEWPEHVGRYWIQAKRNLRDENLDAASVMTRSALQGALRDQGAMGKNLKQEIDDLAAKGLLPPIMKEWSGNLKDLGNDSAHPQPGQPAAQPEDVRDVVRFLDFLLEYLYSLPHQIKEYRERKQKE